MPRPGLPTRPPRRRLRCVSPWREGGSGGRRRLAVSLATTFLEASQKAPRAPQGARVRHPWRPAPRMRAAVEQRVMKTRARRQGAQWRAAQRSSTHAGATAHSEGRPPPRARLHARQAPAPAPPEDHRSAYPRRAPAAAAASAPSGVACAAAFHCSVPPSPAAASGAAGAALEAAAAGGGRSPAIASTNAAAVSPPTHTHCAARLCSRLPGRRPSIMMIECV